MLNISLRSIPDGFYSERSIPDCIDRLTARIDGAVPEAETRPKELSVTGGIDGNRVSLRLAAPSTHPLLARRFSGRFATLDDKTVLAGYFSVDPWITTYIRAWLFVVISCGIIFITDLVIGTQKLVTREAAVAVWGVFVVLYAVVMYMANRTAEADMRIIRNEIRAALD